MQKQLLTFHIIKAFIIVKHRIFIQYLQFSDEIRQIIASLKCKTTSNSYDIPAKF